MGKARGLMSPGNAIMAVACGHVAWGIVVFREPLREIVDAGIVGSVGDGIFDTENDRGARAAGFWFLSCAPLMALSGYLLESALRADDRRAVRVTGMSVLAASAAGTVVIPKSGFPAIAPIGWWLLRRARRC